MAISIQLTDGVWPSGEVLRTDGNRSKDLSIKANRSVRISMLPLFMGRRELGL